MHHISVGLCTYQRPHLRQTLNSLLEQRESHIAKISEIIVVDNDADRSGESIVRHLPTSGIKIIYINEPVKNIAMARNRILQKARGPWLALLDDDEVAHRDWIHQYGMAIEDNNQAAAFFGPILTVYPPRCPAWVSQGQFFDRKVYPHGSRVLTGCSGNALVNLEILSRHGLEFSPAYGLSGGEDSELFFQLHQRGELLYWTSKAQVSENVEDHRLNLEYLKKKHIRIGHTFTKYRMTPGQRHLKYKLKHWIKQCIGHCLSVIFGIIPGTRAHIYSHYWLLQAMDAKGKRLGLSDSEPLALYSIRHTGTAAKSHSDE